MDFVGDTVQSLEALGSIIHLSKLKSKNGQNKLED